MKNFFMAKELINSAELKDWSELWNFLFDNYGEEIRPGQLCVELQTVGKNWIYKFLCW